MTLAHTHSGVRESKRSAGRVVLLISGISHRSKGSIKKWCCGEEAAGLICITTHVRRVRGGLADGRHEMASREGSK